MRCTKDFEGIFEMIVYHLSGKSFLLCTVMYILNTTYKKLDFRGSPHFPYCKLLKGAQGVLVLIYNPYISSRQCLLPVLPVGNVKNGWGCVDGVGGS